MTLKDPRLEQQLKEAVLRTQQLPDSVKEAFSRRRESENESHRKDSSESTTITVLCD
jgi:hypothetical protein